MTTENCKINCQICGGECHAIQIHLRDSHPGVTLDQYRDTYPESPTLSEFAKLKIAEKKKARVKESAIVIEKEKTEVSLDTDRVVKGMNEVFQLAGGGSGKSVGIECFTRSDFPELVPEINEDYVYDEELLKNVLLAFEDNIPILLWGHAGTGKTSLAKQVCARTGRAFMRVQHTPNSEECHFLGQWVLRDGHTVFQLGPLAEAMKYGWVYCADEYDVSRTEVNTVYQSVLEGEPLVIKDADPANRVIRPHKNFRFIATGNTNGTGDETGLYQGTNLGNAANYGRFGMKLKCHYQKRESESSILQKRCSLIKADADRMIDFASLIREAYDGGKISSTIDTRILIFACNIGIKRGSFRKGVTLSFTNGLSRVDQTIVEGISQRCFG